MSGKDRDASAGDRAYLIGALDHGEAAVSDAPEERFQASRARAAEADREEAAKDRRAAEHDREDAAADRAQAAAAREDGPRSSGRTPPAQTTRPDTSKYHSRRDCQTNGVTDLA